MLEGRRLSGLGALSCALTLCVFTLPAEAGGYKQLYTFQGGAADGSDPQYGMVFSQGNLYGTTNLGGASGAGTIFKLTPAGTETVLYSFTGGSDGGGPGGPPVADAAGNLYDVAYEGGGGSCATANANGCGTIFKFSPHNTLTVLYTFKGGDDGASPDAGITMDATGNLYGTTSFGGKGSCNFSGEPLGCGTVFKLTPKGKESVLHAFRGGSKDGAAPYSNLVEDSSGNLYGTTLYGGGKGCGGVGCGTVFMVGVDGTESVLHSFKGGRDGAEPFSALILDKDGNLYGTASAGGAGTACGSSLHCGTIFKLATDGTVTVLYSFCSQPNCSDGTFPLPGVMADKKGNLYGTTVYGGTNNAGTAFELTPNGTESVLHSFAGGSDGAYPQAALTVGSSGKLYGNTSAGSSANSGTAFSVPEP